MPRVEPMRGATADHDVFLRKASGLVRSAGPGDIFLYDVGLISIGIALTLVHGFVPANYRGAHLPLAELVSGLLMLCIIWAFWCWSVAMPRSGGVYIFVSRSLSPTLGFAVSLVETLTWVFYNALAATYVTTIGLAPMLYTCGYHLGSPGMMRLAARGQEPLVQLVVGSVVIALAGAILISGLQTFFRVQKVLFAVAMTGVILTMVAFARSDHEAFRAVFNGAFRSVGPAMAGTVAASTGGQPWTFSWPSTLFAAVWPILSYIGAVSSVNIGGEIRNSRRSQFIGMFGAVVAAAGIMAVCSGLADRVLGMEFQVGLGAYTADEKNAPFPVSPTFSLLAALAANGPVLAFLICLGFLAWAFFWLPGTMLYATRAVIAWSFDRVAPASLGTVHPVRHTPVAAIVAITVVNWILLVLYLYTAFFGKLVLVLAVMIAWLPAMAGAIVFPFFGRDLFRQSGIARLSLLGLPLMSVAGVVGLGAASILTVLLWNDPVAAGHSRESLLTIGVLFAVGLVWYQVARRIRRRRGIDLNRAFRELPIE